jgi:hypothetical protein
MTAWLGWRVLIAAVIALAFVAVDGFVLGGRTFGLEFDKGVFLVSVGWLAGVPVPSPLPVTAAAVRPAA